MKTMGSILRGTAISLALLFPVLGATSAPTAALADPAEKDAPNYSLLSSLVVAGGGPTTFSAQRLRQNLGGSSEDANLCRTYGIAKVKSFDEVFTFVVQDALSVMKQNGVRLPDPVPNPADRQSVAKALFEAGSHDGKFDVEQLFNMLFSQGAHMHAMMAVGQKYGAPGESAYHQVFGQLVTDVGGMRKPVKMKADEHMHGMDGMNSMDMKGMDMRNMSMPVAMPTVTQRPH
jgi:hypothetical protein